MAIRGDRGLPIWLALCPALFGVFKHGFVLPGQGHYVPYFSFSMLLFALVLQGTRERRHSNYLQGASLTFLCVCYLVFSLGISAGPKTFLDHVTGRVFVRRSSELVEHEWLGYTSPAEIANSKNWPEWFKLPTETLAALDGESVSVISSELAYIPANQLIYRPLPTVFDTTAYTPYLDGRNAQFLSDPATAPIFVIADWSPLWGFHPTISAPQTWETLFRWYDFDRALPGRLDFLLASRRQYPRYLQPETLAEGTYRVGDVVPLPEPPSEATAHWGTV